jgi:Dickkopf N-terminal cysteine-rich region
LSNTVCQSLKACCGTGAKFDTAKCIATYSGSAGGGWMGSGYVIPYQDSGRVAYDTSAACQCLEGNATINCGLVPQQTWNSIGSSCVGAVHGDVPAQIAAEAGTSDAGTADAGDGGSSACASSYECAEGAYCTVQNPSDPGSGALGTCLPLVPSGGGCTSDYQCSYLANGTPPLYCGPSNTCIPRLDAGAACQTNENCTLNNCSGFTCQSGIVFSDQVGAGGICDYFTLPDGG